MEKGRVPGKRTQAEGSESPETDRSERDKDNREDARVFTRSRASDTISYGLEREASSQSV